MESRTFRGAAPRRSVPAGLADLVLRNARVITMDAAVPEAEAVAFAGDQVLAVGTAADVDRLSTSSTIFHDLHGQCACCPVFTIRTTTCWRRPTVARWWTSPRPGRSTTCCAC